MKNKQDAESTAGIEADAILADAILTEYEFDYQKARLNRFARTLVITLDPDVAKVFTTAESVNNALRAILSAMPKTVNHNNPST